MFEIIGYLTLRAHGYGWLWGRRHFQRTCVQQDVYGNGGPLFIIGLVGSAYWMVIFNWIAGKLWQ